MVVGSNKLQVFSWKGFILTKAPGFLALINLIAPSLEGVLFQKFSGVYSSFSKVAGCTQVCNKSGYGPLACRYTKKLLKFLDLCHWKIHSCIAHIEFIYVKY